MSSDVSTSADDRQPPEARARGPRRSEGNAGPTRVWVEVNGSRSELACVCVSSAYELRLKASASGLRNTML
jgi:hypothetical protein